MRLDLFTATEDDAFVGAGSLVWACDLFAVATVDYKLNSGRSPPGPGLQAKTEVGGVTLR